MTSLRSRRAPTSASTLVCRVSSHQFRILSRNFRFHALVAVDASRKRILVQPRSYIKVGNLAIGCGGGGKQFDSDCGRRKVGSPSAWEIDQIGRPGVRGLTSSGPSQRNTYSAPRVRPSGYTAMRDPLGRLIGFSKITCDLTERKKAEEAIQATRTQLAHMARVKTVGELTASMPTRLTSRLRRW